MQSLLNSSSELQCHQQPRPGSRRQTLLVVFTFRSEPQCHKGMQLSMPAAALLGWLQEGAQMCSAAHLATSGSLMTTIGLCPNMICTGEQNIMHNFFQYDRARLCRIAQCRFSDYMRPDGSTDGKKSHHVDRAILGIPVTENLVSASPHEFHQASQQPQAHADLHRMSQSCLMRSNMTKRGDVGLGS